MRVAAAAFAVASIVGEGFIRESLSERNVILFVGSFLSFKMIRGESTIASGRFNLLSPKRTRRSSVSRIIEEK